MENRIDQFTRVVGLRVFEQHPAFALFDNPAVAQNDGAIAHHANHIKVVADEEQ